jgi:beta-N-acetylhexosaminidase
VTLALTAASMLAAASMTPQQQAALVVVSGLPAPPGVGGVLVQGWSKGLRRPKGALVYVDQEGGGVRAFTSDAPGPPASAHRTRPAAYAAGRAAGRAMTARGVHVDLAPVVDLADGPLGSRHFLRPELAVSFARGLAAAGVAACAKHFPGLGSTPISTDERPHVDGAIRLGEIAAFRAAIRAGIPCVMTSNAFYDGAPYRASISPDTYRRLRALGFDGVAITDSLSIVKSAPVERWARQAILAGADLLLFTSGAHARRAIAALVPLAREGKLGASVERVLRLRSRLPRARRP